MNIDKYIIRIKKYDNEELSHFAKQYSSSWGYDYFKEEEGIESGDVMRFAEELTRELMRRNLIIPRGSGIDLMEIAEVLAKEPEFDKKYT